MSLGVCVCDFLIEGYLSSLEDIFLFIYLLFNEREREREISHIDWLPPAYTLTRAGG